MPVKDGAQFHELYGDGLFWAGCTLIHLLGQKERFNTFNFTYHTLAINDDPPFPLDSSQYPVRKCFAFFNNLCRIQQDLLKTPKL